MSAKEIISPALVTRQKHHQHGSRFQWEWLYSVNGVTRTTSLAEAEAYCKRQGFTPIRSWEDM